METIYLAGPFFNKAQLELMQRVYGYIKTKTDHKIYWPWKDARFLPPDASRDERVEVFTNEIDAIRNSSMVLACMDYLLPNTGELRVLEHTKLQSVCINHSGETDTKNIGNMQACNCIVNGVVKSPPLNIPDTGTVFEIGFANALTIPVVGWTTYTDHRKARVNLMLAVGMSGVLYGYGELRTFLGCTVVNWSSLDAYAGKII